MRRRDEGSGLTTGMAQELAIQEFEIKVLPAIADVLAKARQEWALDAEQSADGAEDKIATRRLVDEAKAVLMERDGLPEAEAFAFIQRTAMQTRSRMRDVAQQIVDGTRTP